MRSIGRAGTVVRIAIATQGVALALAGGPAHASFFAGEALDKAADVLTWVVLILVPVIGITVFWLVHILPEKIAHKRHHPQLEAIKTLCLLSLVFGGMLWPFAWLWAYTKPVGYRLAYGTEKHDDYYVEMAQRAEAGELDAKALRDLKDELSTIERRGGLSPALRDARARIESVGGGAAPGNSAGAAAAPATSGIV
jgi:CBS domain containing-hemolysin-like protein